jgi:hypothetical protein
MRRAREGGVHGCRVAVVVVEEHVAGTSS